MADLTGMVLLCKRPFTDLDPREAERTGSVLTRCQDCGCDLYAVPKNLNRGMVLLCAPCVWKRYEPEVARGEALVILPGKSIGSPEEDTVREAAGRLERILDKWGKL